MTYERSRVVGVEGPDGRFGGLDGQETHDWFCVFVSSKGDRRMF
jgi:hypothetical protein